MPPAGISPQMFEPTRIVLERKSQAAGKNEYPGSGYALLVGYTASPLRPAGASAGWPRRERALVALRVAALPDDTAAAGETPVQPLQQGNGDPDRPASPTMRGAGADASSGQQGQ